MMGGQQVGGKQIVEANMLCTRRGRTLRHISALTQRLVPWTLLRWCLVPVCSYKAVGYAVPCNCIPLGDTKWARVGGGHREIINCCLLRSPNSGWDEPPVTAFPHAPVFEAFPQAIPCLTLLLAIGKRWAAPLCDIPSGCCSFTGPWTVTRSSLRILYVCFRT